MMPTLRIRLLLMVLVVAAFNTACSSAPPAREIPQNTIDDLKARVNARNELAIGREALRGSATVLDMLGDRLNPTMKDDVVALTEQLRTVIESANVDDLRLRIDELRARTGVLGRALVEEKTSSELLQKVKLKMSPVLLAKATDRIGAISTALRAGDWANLQAAIESSQKLRYQDLDAAWDLQSSDESLEFLSREVSRSLKVQMEDALLPLRRALRGDNWESVERAWHVLPRLAVYPGQITAQIRQASEFGKKLHGSESEALNAWRLRLNTALGDNNWEAALAAAEKFNEIPTSLGVGGPMYHSASLSGWAPCTRVLSIDGGGVRGVIPAALLAEIEHRTGRRATELFDLIVGTSTGSIIALGLAMPDSKYQSQPKYTAQEIVGLYEAEARTIFPADSGVTLRSLFRPRYRTTGLEKVLKAYFNDSMFGDALTHVVVPAYDVQNRRHVFMDSQNEDGRFFYTWEVIRGATAAPTYFPMYAPPQLPASLAGLSGSQVQDMALIDGGVFANNPVSHAISIAKREAKPLGNKRHREYGEQYPMLVLSLGTGRVPPSITYEKDWNWGLLQWADPVLDTVFSDPGVEQEARDLLSFSDYYFRLEPETLDKKTADMANSSPENLQKLESIAQEYLQGPARAQIDTIVHLLMRERPEKCPHSVSEF